MAVNCVGIKFLQILLSFLSMIIYEVLGVEFKVSQSYFFMSLMITSITD